MKVFKKINNGLMELGEGKLYSKSQLKLNENGFDANIGSAVGIQAAQQRAKQLMNQNAGVESASIEAGKADGQRDSTSGEGLKLELPVNATGQQLAQAERMTRDQSMDDAQITFTKPQTSTSTTTESRVMEMRRNSIPFTKKELHNFLSEI